MPIRDILVPEASSAILEPISEQMVYAILSRLGLGAAFSDNIYIMNDYTKPSLTSDENSNAQISKDRCDVKMSVSWNPTETKWDVSSFKYTQAYGIFSALDHTLMPILADPVADIRLVEHQLPCSMVLEFTLQFKNRESAFSVISVINNTSYKDSVVNPHNLAYSYPLGDDLVRCLYTLYELRQPFVNVDFLTYLRICSQGSVQYLQQRTGSNTTIVFKRIDLKALGVLDYTQTAPTVQDQDRGIDRFVVEFTYTVQFARPDVLRLDFPVTVCNQPVPPWMVRLPPQDSLEFTCGRLQEMSVGAYLQSLQIPYTVVTRRPVYDDFRPPQTPVMVEGFVEVFTSALYLDNGPTTTIDLLQLGDNTRLHDTVAAIMKLQGDSVFTTTGIFNVTVYCNGIPVDRSCISIDDNLIITLKMSHKEKRYHLVLSEAIDLRSLDEKWYSVLIANRTFFPLTVVRNLKRLLDRRFCYIDRSNIILRIVDQQIGANTIDAQITTLITEGHLTYYAFMHTVTAEQFVDYLLETRSPVTHRPAYDAYVQLCLEAGLLTSSQLASGHLRLPPDGFPVLPSSFHQCQARQNYPMRIWWSKLVVTESKNKP